MKLYSVYVCVRIENCSVRVKLHSVCVTVRDTTHYSVRVKPLCLRYSVVSFGNQWLQRAIENLTSREPQFKTEGKCIQSVFGVFHRVDRALSYNLFILPSNQNVETYFHSSLCFSSQFPRTKTHVEMSLLPFLRVLLLCEHSPVTM